MKKIILLILLFIVAIPTPKVLATKEIGFEVTDSTRSWEIGRDKTYDYSPSVLKEDNGETKIYTCGGGVPGDPYAGHDAIYLTIFDKNGAKTLDQKRVLSPLINNSLSDDAVHTCAPSVIKHSFSLLEGGKEKYLMYFECGPQIFKQSDGTRVDAFTQICVAFSDDGLTWQKYNKDIWNSEYRFANENESPTPVIKINPLMAAKYGIEKIDGKYWTSLTAFDINSYGVGHPSALVINGQIWLYYYDSVGEWPSRGVFLAKSSDGFHFETPIQITDLLSPPNIQYVKGPINGQPGFFLYLGNAFVPYYNYSYDGIHWAWKEQDSVSFYTDFLANNYSMGAIPNGKCSAPGGRSIAADKFGNANSLSVDIFSNEGFMGSSDGCTATNGCTCYSPLEDQSRGYTWQTYRYQGKFVSIVAPTPVPTPKPGDLNADGKINISDYNILLQNFGNTTCSNVADIDGNCKVDIFDYNVLVGNFGSP
jgi:hypothetical protein